MLILPALGVNITCEEREWFWLDNGKNHCVIKNENLDESEPIVVISTPYGNDEIIEVRFEGGNVTHLSKELFKIFKNVEQLSFVKCDLQAIKQGNFANAGKLAVFTSSENAILELPARAFSGAESLDKIMIEKSLLQKIDDDAFVGLSKLNQLDFEQNNITQISEKVFAPLVNLTHLIMVQNKITALQAGIFKNNQKLKQVDFSGNRINIIDPNLFCLNHNIIVLGFDRNACVDTEFVVGTNVFHVELSKCYDNFFASPEFISKKVSKFQYYRCFLETMEDHQKLIYQHLFEDFQNQKKLNNQEWVQENSMVSQLQTKQNWIIAVLFLVVITMSAYIVFVQFKMSELNGSRGSVTMSDLQQLVR